MLASHDALLVTSALSQMEGRSRREWKHTLQTLRLLDLTWSDLAEMGAPEAWKWLGWNESFYRQWLSALSVARAQLERSIDAGISVATELDEDVPFWLKTLNAVPWVFYRGDASLLDCVTVGFSGQRDAGEESLAITVALAEQAARLGYTVVSGGARGIDMAAHVAVLEAGGATAVVLPQGLATWNPPHALANRQVAGRVLVLGEDVPWEAWNTDSAMRRNRMIVDLSRIFTVPQSGTSGGSHSTGMYALNHDRVTFVPDLGPGYPGNLRLLQRGARPLVMQDGRPDLERMLIDSQPVDKPSQASLF